MRFLAFILAIFYSNLLSANQSSDSSNSLDSYNDHEPMTISDRLLGITTQEKLPLTEEEKRIIFLDKLEEKNKPFVKQSIELIRIQNKIEIVNNLENSIHKTFPQPKKVFYHSHLTK
ncbi:MAG: hypothetical protein HN576_16315 [Bacteriovoracaceae bacterium]|nr:hypothetical protein [Bacteriovoracaceae bacterium]